MACSTKIGVPSPCAPQSNCPDSFGCPSDQCPDFVIKRHDIMPPFRVDINDCDGPLDLSDSSLVLEVNMWAKGKLKASITDTDTYFALADNIGFQQAMVGDIIIMDRVRLPEYMLVTGFDENNNLINVQRAYSGTTASIWKKGTPLRIFRIMGAIAEIHSVFEDITQEDGTIQNTLTGTYFVYNWSANDTCLPGCYWLEFKLLKMLTDYTEKLNLGPSITPSFTPSSFTPTDFGCTLGDSVEYVRRFPIDVEGFLVKIANSFTAEI